MSIKTNQMITPKWTILSFILTAIMVASLVLFTGCTQEPISSIDPGLDDSIFFNLNPHDSYFSFFALYAEIADDITVISSLESSFLVPGPTETGDCSETLKIFDEIIIDTINKTKKT